MCRTQLFLRTCTCGAFEPAGERIGRVVQDAALCGYGSVSLFPGTLPAWFHRTRQNAIFNIGPSR
jgi:hypothetical protein